MDANLLAGAHQFAVEVLRHRRCGTLIVAMALAGLAGVLRTFLF